MKPVCIVRYSVTEGPGYFATFLDRNRVPWALIKIDEGEPVPADASAYSGLGFMGGAMSANDPLPWIAPVLALIRQAVEDDVPVIGHCLGGQLMSKALGGVVSRNPVKEIGWGRVDIVPGAEGQRWLGGRASFDSFHWHGETFTIPPGAVRTASSPYCHNQMFTLGKHLGMQCHIEMTPDLVASWCADWEKEVASLAAGMPSVQAPAQMLADIAGKTGRLHGIADCIYARWISGLAR